MKRILLFFISVIWLGFNLNAQNTNEGFSDVNYGGAIDNEEFEASLPDMKLTAESVAKSIPSSVDNSGTIYMPPIFERIEDETTSYNDSIFATIDLGNLYLKMNDDGLKGIQGKLTQFIPKSREDHSLRTDYALRLLDNNSNKSTKYHELTGYYWTDHVTEQPEGFDIDDNGNRYCSFRCRIWNPGSQCI